MKWLPDRTFDRDFKRLRKRHHNLEEELEATKHLLNQYFDPKESEKGIKPGKISRIHSYDDQWSMYKVHVIVNGLKPSLWPRVWFITDTTTIIFLRIASHSDNYKDNTIQKEAYELAENYLLE